MGGLVKLFLFAFVLFLVSCSDIPTYSIQNVQELEERNSEVDSFGQQNTTRAIQQAENPIIENNEESTEEVVEEEQEEISTPKEIDCGTSFKCLIDEAQTCQKSAATIEKKEETNSKITKTTNRAFIRGFIDGWCIYHEEVIDIRVTFTDEYREELETQGETNEEIDDLEEEETEKEEDRIGDELLCKYDVIDMVDLLTSWRENDNSFRPKITSLSESEFKKREMNGEYEECIESR
jgi:hypothetical protein